MKRVYEKPFIEMIEFNYSEQVVVASGEQTTNIGYTTCENWTLTNPDIQSCGWGQN